MWVNEEKIKKRELSLMFKNEGGGEGGRRFSRDREESMGPIRGEAKGGLVAVSESVSCSTAIDKIVTNGVP